MSVGEEEDVPIEPPAMRQAIAWGFARRALVEQETSDARQLLLARADVDDVRNVKVGSNLKSPELACCTRGGALALLQISNLSQRLMLTRHDTTVV